MKGVLRQIAKRLRRRGALALAKEVETAVEPVVAAVVTPVITEDDYDQWEAGEGKWTDPKVKKAWKGYIMKMSYGIVTEESAQEGDYAERGWEHKKEKYEYLQELLEDSPVSYKSWLEWSSSPARPGDWIVSEEDQDYSSGETTTYDLFIERADRKPLSKEEMQFIHKELNLHGRV